MILPWAVQTKQTFQLRQGTVKIVLHSSVIGDRPSHHLHHLHTQKSKALLSVTNAQ